MLLGLPSLLPTNKETGSSRALVTNISDARTTEEYVSPYHIVVSSSSRNQFPPKSPMGRLCRERSRTSVRQRFLLHGSTTENHNLSARDAWNFSVEKILETNLYKELGKYRTKYCNNGAYDPVSTHKGTATNASVPITHWRAIFYLFELDREIQVSIVPKYTNLGDDWKRSLNKGDDRIYTKVRENQLNDIVQNGNSH